MCRRAKINVLTYGENNSCLLIMCFTKRAVHISERVKSRSRLTVSLSSLMTRQFLVIIPSQAEGRVFLALQVDISR